MLAGIYNITCQQGSTFARTITFKYPDPNSPPADPTYLFWNFTGYTARMQVRRTIDSSTIIISLTTENGRITLGGATGIIELNITAADTATLTSSGVYDLEIISNAGVVNRILQGNFTLSQEVTR
jgi:hypothetical protein